MHRFALLSGFACLFATQAASQLAAQTNARAGRYYFLELTTADSPKGREVATAAGTLMLAPDACSADARLARNQDAAKPIAPKLACKKEGDSGFTIDAPSGLGGSLRLSAGEGARMLVGAGSKPGAHTFFAAIAAPDTSASGAPTAPIPTHGVYRAAWIQATPFLPRGLSSGLLTIPFSPRQVDDKATLISHSTEFDDVARSTSLTIPKLEINPAGSGTLTFSATEPDAPLSGTRDIMFSPDGSFFLAWSTAAGPREIFVGLRADPDAATFSWMGAFAIAELSATVPYEMNSKPALISSALGTARNAGSGTIDLDESVWDGKSALHLITRNTCRIGSDGSSMIGPVLHATQTNLAIGGTPVAFLGIQIGPMNELSLDHGIFFGIRTSQAVPPAPAPLAVTHADGSPVEPAKPARSGEAISITLPGAKPGPTRVLIDGLEAESKSGAALTVTVPTLKRSGIVPLAVAAPGILHDITDLAVQQ